jgi:predicted nucleic acid-binding protein
VGLDTAPLIYYIEENPTYLDVIVPFFECIADGRFRVVTSTVTLLEVLVQPMRCGNNYVADEYRDILLNSQISVVSLTADIASQAAKLRATHGIRTPDAIQLATAINEGASTFVTNDFGLSSVMSIDVIVLDELTS